ncbi:BnaC05g23840D [Brassica napus]|uniref:BnaC05g23840D protein n=1 Tax=Brassica napus TaxID=3708 RepID=A0A078F545_BRANA|nr:BnaC05g23840D [Brassica napus]
MENTRLILSQITGLLYASSCIRGKFISLILGTRRSPKMRTREIAMCTL